NAPSLFLIAKDLTRMQIWVSVNEADIGRIAPATPATFNCDAFPGRTFKGSVGKVRLNATMTQNVVMYTVEVNTENPDNLLIPYLTANVHFAVQTAHGALLLPNAALRWTPSSASDLSPDSRASWKPDGAEPTASASAAPATSPEKDGAGAPKRRIGTVWVRDSAFVRPIQVELGATDGAN